MKIKEALKYGRETLAASRIEDASLEAEVLLRHALNMDRVRFFLEMQKELAPSQEKTYREAITRRINGEPSAYITGHREFCGLNFIVDNRVLIPRQETELLVEAATDIAITRASDTRQKSFSFTHSNPSCHSDFSLYHKDWSPSQPNFFSRRSGFSAGHSDSPSCHSDSPSCHSDSPSCHSERREESASPPPGLPPNNLPTCFIADIGTGSGAIAVSLASRLKDAVIYAVDISPECLEVAAENACKHGVSGCMRFLQGDLLSPLPEPVDMIIANLPYVSKEDLREVNTWGHEPALALNGGVDGLDIIRCLIGQSREILKPGGALLLEIGQDQGTAVTEMLADSFPDSTIKLISDHAGIERVATMLLSL